MLLCKKGNISGKGTEGKLGRVHDNKEVEETHEEEKKDNEDNSQDIRTRSGEDRSNV